VSFTDSEKRFSAEPFERTDEQQMQSMMRERRAVMQVRRFMSNSDRYRDNHLKIAERSREMYENWNFSGRTMINRANLRLPFGYTVVETLLPKLTDVFLSDDEIIKWEGQDSSDAQWENIMTDFHSVQFKNMKFSPKFIASLKSMLLDGTMIAKIPYRYQERITKQRRPVDPLSGEEGFAKEDVLTVTFDGPDYEHVAMHDFFPDWSVKNPGDVQSMRACVHRMYKTFNSLKTLEKRGNQGIYKNLDQLKTSVRVKGSANAAAWQAPFFSDKFRDRFDRLNDNASNIKDGNKIEIWEYWGLWDPKGDGNFEEYILTIANGDVIIREQKNFYDMQFKPFVACPNIPRDNEFFGIPELIAVRPLIKEANAIRNARLDNINISANPMWIVDRAAGINLQNLYSRPNGVILSNDMNGIRPVQMPDPSAGSLQESAAIQQDIQNATALISATPQTSSATKAALRSATGANLVASISNDRIRMKAKLISDLFLKAIAKMMMQINMQFVDTAQEVRLSDPRAEDPFGVLPPEAFIGNFFFKTKSDLESGGREGEMERMNAALQMAQIAEQSQPGTMNFGPLIEDMMRPLLGNRVGKYTRSDEERMALQQQQLAAEQATNAQVGQRAPQPNAQPDILALLGGGQ
jgi:hypothetical protein